MGANRATFRWLAMLAAGLAAASGLPSALAQRQPALRRGPAAAPGRHDRRCPDRGHPAHRAGNGALLPAAAAGRCLGRRADRPLAEGAVCDRAVRRCEADSRGQYAGRPGRREPDHQPHRLRGKLEDRRQGSQRRSPAARRASSIPAPACRTMSGASSSYTAGRAASPRPSSPRSSSCRKTGSISCSRSTRDHRPACAAINFVGNRKFSDWHAARRDRDQGKPLVSVPVDHRTPTIPTALTYDRELLRKFYLSEGYADFRVVSAVAELTPDRDGFILTFTVDEGERYRFGNVDVDIALKDLPREAVLPLLTVQPGDWYNAEAVERSIAVLTDALGNRGYAFVEIKPEITRNRDDAHGRHRLSRAGGAAGLCRADRHHRQRAHAGQGDPPRVPPCRGRRLQHHSDAAFEGAHQKSRLLQEGRGQPTAPGSAPDRTVIAVEVEEQSTGELSLGLGFSTSDGPLADVTYPRAQFPRPRPGPAASARCSRSARNRSISASPSRISSTRTSRPASICSRSRPARPRNFFTRRHAGLPADSPMAARCARAIRSPKTCARPGNTPPAPTTSPMSRATPRCSFSCRQARTRPRRSARFCSMTGATTGIEPTDGYFASIGNDFAGVGFGVQYFRNKVNVGYYYSVAPEWVLSFTGEAGYIFGWGGEQVLAAGPLLRRRRQSARFRAGRHRAARHRFGRRARRQQILSRLGRARRAARLAEGAGHQRADFYRFRHACGRTIMKNSS